MRVEIIPNMKVLTDPALLIKLITNFGSIIARCDNDLPGKELDTEALMRGKAIARQLFYDGKITLAKDSETGELEPYFLPDNQT